MFATVCLRIAETTPPATVLEEIRPIRAMFRSASLKASFDANDDERVFIADAGDGKYAQLVTALDELQSRVAGFDYICVASPAAFQLRPRNREGWNADDVRAITGAKQ